MATNFSPCKGSYVLNQFPSNVMFGMNRFHVSASGAIQGHHGPLVVQPACGEQDSCHNDGLVYVHGPCMHPYEFVWTITSTIVDEFQNNLTQVLHHM